MHIGYCDFSGREGFMDKRWAAAPAPRHQQVLFAETLDEVVGSQHPIRRLEEHLSGVDWTLWEARYAGHRGQPPLHPRLVAGGILYGLMRRVRSSRDLEAATHERLDFLWFLEGRTIDHSTFAGFRIRFEAELKDLFRQLARAMCRQDDAEGALVGLVIDGTRVRANSERQGARTADWLARQIAQCEAELNRRFARLAQSDAEAAAPSGPDGTGPDEIERLPGEVARLRAQVSQYEQALVAAHERDAAKRAKDGAGALAVRVPVTDPDSMIVPNKEGGFAPNYTPTVAVDLATGTIVCAEVLAGSDENTAVLSAVAEAECVTGVKPGQVLADSGFASGENLQALAAQGTAAYMPTDTDFRPENPAQRPDVTQAVPESQWKDLPRRGGKLGRAAFVYEAEADQYRCPMGAALGRTGTGESPRKYQCPGKAGCPLAGQCVKGKASARMIVRDEYQAEREIVGRRMATPEGRAVYRKRAPVVEGTFAGIKHTMGIRRFLVRGLQKVRMEWNWICAGYNLKRLINPKAQMVKEKAQERAGSLSCLVSGAPDRWERRSYVGLRALAVAIGRRVRFAIPLISLAYRST
jgi:transposase